MEKTKIDRIIEVIRENMTVGTGGFTSSGNTPVYAKGGPKSRIRWLDYLKSSDGRRN